MNEAPEPQIAQTSQSDATDSAPSAVPSGRKRARLTAEVPDEVVAKYTMARAFLLGEWFGASLMVASFALLYFLAFGSDAATTVTYAVCMTALALGTWAYFSGRRYYERTGFPYAQKWHAAAAVTAGSAGIFWLLFVLLVILAWFGITLLPE